MRRHSKNGARRVAMGISRKARIEHFYSGLPQKADIRAYEYTP